MERMSRVSLIAVFASLLPIAAAAQVPVPAAPPAPPAPMTPPAPVAPVAAPAPMAVPAPMIAPAVPLVEMPIAPPALGQVYIDRDAMQRAVEAARSIDADAIRDQVRAAADAVRAEADQAREMARMNIDMSSMRMAPMAYAYGWDQDFQSFRATGDSNYSQGLSYLQSRQYENAIARFDRVIAAKSTHADGALYYKAWALSKLGRSDDAVAALNELKSAYGSSPYLPEARVLEANVRKLGPSQVDDDDIKLLAISAIQYSDPDKAVSVCESVLNSTNSLQVKRRAIYVLALIDKPEAHQLLLSYAKGKGNPELQREAITYLGAHNAKQPTKSAELIDIYNATSDVDVKMAVISAFRSAGDKQTLMQIASGQGVGLGVGNGKAMTVISQAQIDGLKSRAISNLSDLASPQELWPLYQKEENKDLRSEWISTFASMGAIDQLQQAVKTEKEPTVRARAIRALGNQKIDRTGTMLTDLYANGDKDTKNAVISALSNQNNADGLISIARKETDKDMKLAIVRRIAEMAPHSKAAADYLLEFVK